jgi:hypothetical protein
MDLGKTVHEGTDWINLTPAGLRVKQKGFAKVEMNLWVS